MASGHWLNHKSRRKRGNLDEKDTVDHETDIVFRDGRLSSNWYCHLLQGMDIGDLFHLQWQNNK